MEIPNIFFEIKTPVIVLHVLSVVLGMGAALTADILFTFYSKDKKFNQTELKTLSILSQIVLVGLVLIIFTGAIIFLSDISKYLASVKFLTKMTIVVVLLINGFVLHRYVWRHLVNNGFFILKRESTVRKVSFACGAISIISWVFILMLGVLDSVSTTYNFLILLYLGLLVCGILLSLLIERKKFEQKNKRQIQQDKT